MKPVDLRQTVCALAEALSLVGIDETQHGERVAVMALACARELVWTPEWQDDLIHAALLHDCGVSSSRVHRKLINELDWEGSDTHCLLGEQYLAAFPPLAHLAPTVRYHHTHWDELAGLDMPDQTRQTSNLIYLADRADALAAGLQEDPPEQRAASVRERLQPLGESFFDPKLLEVFLALSARPAFWDELEPEALGVKILQLPNANPRQIASADDLRQLARIFATIVDAKSRFTYEHSVGVARVAVHLAGRLELPEPVALQIEISALLHDLGKLGVPDEILEKRGRLEASEWKIMRHHSLNSYQILRRIQGFEKIAEWAGNHHETLMGDGYPFHRRADELDPEARLITVADVFQALAQDRPYRHSLPPAQILSMMRELAAQYRIDGSLVELLAEDLDLCWRLARSPG